MLASANIPQCDNAIALALVAAAFVYRRLTAPIERRHVDVREWSAKYDASEEPYIASAVTSVVTDALHLPTEDAKLGNESARSGYRKGLGFLRRDKTIPDSLAAFNEVVRADPDSALGYAGLAEALSH